MLLVLLVLLVLLWWWRLPWRILLRRLLMLLLRGWGLSILLRPLLPWRTVHWRLLQGRLLCNARHLALILRCDGTDRASWAILTWLNVVGLHIRPRIVRDGCCWTDIVVPLSILGALEWRNSLLLPAVPLLLNRWLLWRMRRERWRLRVPIGLRLGRGPVLLVWLWRLRRWSWRSLRGCWRC